VPTACAAPVNENANSTAKLDAMDVMVFIKPLMIIVMWVYQLGFMI
jgi:hypothetical protein